MFSFLTKPAEDELFATWINDMLERNTAKKNSDKKSYLKRMIGPQAERILHFEDRRYFPDAEDLCKAERRSAIFPLLMDIMERHTDIYALLPLTNKAEQVKRTEYCLHGLEDKPGMRIRYLYNQKLKVCPECMKEDLEKYGRKIIHVPHQLYVNTCWKHGCSLEYLSDASPVIKEPNQQDIEKATFAHDLYTHPVIANFTQTDQCIDNKLQEIGLTREEAFARSTDAGYTDQDASDTFFTGNVYVQINDEFYDFYIGFLTWLFKTADQFRTSLETWNPAEEYNRDDFELLDSDGIIGEFKCRSCGHIFHMHFASVEYGVPCPKCIKTMDDIQIYQRYADCLNDGKYNIIQKDGKIHVIHEECGLDRTTKFFTIVGRHSACPICSEKHARDARNGKQIGDMKIIDYKHADDVTVQMNDGTIVDHRNYFYVKQGIETYTREHMGEEMSKKQVRTDRVGKKNVNYQGVEMEITSYRSIRDIDIKFANGDEVQHRKYEDFKKGRIRCPSYIKNQRIGETNVNGHGRKMTIIDYRNTGDIDVRFDTGKIVKHTSYEHFKKGYIRCPM